MKNDAIELAKFCETAANNAAVKEKDFYIIAAAHLAFINKDYVQSHKLLTAAKKQALNTSLKDQWALTNLLVTINEKDSIDAAFEAAILPSVQWLEQKATTETATDINYWQEKPWHQFYRNLMNDVLAKRYHQQNQITKEALCIGKADIANNSQVGTYDFVQDGMETKDVLQLNNMLKTAKRTAWENYLCKDFPMSKDAVTEVIAMSHVRDFNFTKALEWFEQIKDTAVLHLERNPFGDLLKDNQNNKFSFDKGKFSKYEFLKEMKRLTDKEMQGKATAADLYKLAVGYYNITYYGRAWEMVKHYRPSSIGYYIPKDATTFLQEYYGCFTAEKYFEKAMKASADNNYKAHCLFMMAKCSQKQIAQPQYEDFGDKWANYESAEKIYLKQFKSNKYFPQLVKRYAGTSFYKQAFNTCSYLSDFVRKK